MAHHAVMIAAYKRNSRTFSELGLDDPTPLSAAIPELSIAPGLPTPIETSAKTDVLAAGCAERDEGFAARTHSSGVRTGQPNRLDAETDTAYAKTYA
jgi:hypothetical protein